jgi:hypothetical protein
VLGKEGGRTWEIRGREDCGGEDKVVAEGMTSLQMGPVCHIHVGAVKLGLLLELELKSNP